MALLAMLAGANPKIPFVTGLSGTTYAQRNATVASRVDPAFSNSAKAVVLDVGGPSDLLANLSAAQILTAAEAYADARRAAGADVIVEFTVTPSTIYTAGQNAQRISYNNLLRANANHKFDAIVDMAAIPQLQNPLNTTYFYDQLHPTTAGALLIAQLARSTLASIGIS